jgi:uncharacterized membrane protein YhaH (DUF805 family)
MIFSACPLGFITMYNIILACTQGDQGDNQYGSDPKAADIPYN